MKDNSAPSSSSGVSLKDLGYTSQYLLAFAACGWLVLIGNLFPIARLTHGVIPEVKDLPGLIASTLVLAVLALTPFVLRHMFASRKKTAP